MSRVLSLLLWTVVIMSACSPIPPAPVPPSPVLPFAPVTKRGLAAAGSGFAAVMPYVVYTQAQSQAVVNDANPHWWYTYTSYANSVRPPNGFFVPMIYNLAGSAIDLAFGQPLIDRCVAEAGPNGYILFLNEPDLNGISVAAAVTAWNTLAADPGVVANNIRLVSPSMGGNFAVGDWLDQWYTAVTRKPNAIAVHAYGTTPTDIPAAQLKIFTRLAQFESRYPGLAMWLTEWCFTLGSPTAAQDIALMTAVQPLLESRSTVQMYSWWYGGPASIAAAGPYPNCYLYDDAAAASAWGAFYKTIG